MSDLIHFACSKCHYPLKSPEGTSGQQLTCPRCKEVATVPDLRARRMPPPPLPAPAPSYHSHGSYPRAYHDEPPHRPTEPQPVTTAVPFAWLAAIFRYSSPSLRALILLLLPLPFVEVNCLATPGGSGFTALWQSGLQAMLGSYSENRDLIALNQPVAMPQNPFPLQPMRIARDDTLTLMVLLVMAGLAVSAAAPLGTGRSITLCVFSGIISLLLLAHLGLGFPLEQTIANEKMQAIQNAPDPQAVQVAQTTAMLIQTRPTGWFVLWAVLLFSTVILAVAEAICVGVLGGRITGKPTVRARPLRVPEPWPD